MTDLEAFFDEEQSDIDNLLRREEAERQPDAETRPAAIVEGASTCPLCEMRVYRYPGRTAFMKRPDGTTRAISKCSATDCPERN